MSPRCPCTLRHLVRAERRAATRTVRNALVPLVEQSTIGQLFQDPPDALHIARVERDVGPRVVEPVSDALGEVLPVLLVREHRASAGFVELGDTQSFDLRFTTDSQPLFGLDLNRQTVRIPAGDSRYTPAFHRPQPTHQVLDGAADDVMEAGLAVRRGRSLEEHEGLTVLRRFERLVEEILTPPAAESLLFKRQKGVGYLGISHRFVPVFCGFRSARLRPG